MKLWDRLQLDFDRHRMVTLVGGGGKTTLLYALAQEARAAGRTVIVTTSTHMRPHPRIFCTQCSAPAALRALLAQHGILTLGAPCCGEKICGTGELVACKAAADVLIIEGDGAKFLPLKAPAEHEPVIPPESDAVVAVAGMDAIGQPIGTICHRPERVCALLDKPPAALVTVQDVARLLASADGGRKRVAEGMAYRCALNKTEQPDRAAYAHEITALLAGEGIFAAETQFEEKERGGLCWF